MDTISELKIIYNGKQKIIDKYYKFNSFVDKCENFTHFLLYERFDIPFNYVVWCIEKLFRIRYKIVNQGLAALISVIGIAFLIHFSSWLIGAKIIWMVICLTLLFAIFVMTLFFIRRLLSFGAGLRIANLSARQLQRLHTLDSELAIKLQDIQVYKSGKKRNNVLAMQRLGAQTRLSLNTYARSNPNLQSAYELFDSYLYCTFYSSGNI